MAVFTTGTTVPDYSLRASNLEVGSSVFLEIDGTPVEFYVVHHGNPDTALYDASCDGVWLLARYGYVSKMAWHSSAANNYANSDMHSYLNGDFYELLGSIEKETVMQVKIPYTSAGGTSSTIYSGANGLSTKVFLLSANELGMTSADSSYVRDDGAKLDYFLSGTGADAVALRVAYYNGYTTSWLLRSPRVYSGYPNRYVLRIMGTGSLDVSEATASASNLATRPALILPHDAKFDPESRLLMGVA